MFNFKNHSIMDQNKENETNEKKSIMESLGLIPELVEACENIIKANEQTQQISGRVLEKGVVARVPEEELKKIGDTAAERTAKTTCKLPPVEEVAHQIAIEVGKHAAAEVQSAVKEAVSKTRIPLEHTYTFVTPWEIRKFLEGKAGNWLVFLAIWSFLVTVCLVGCLFWYFDSDVYYGRQYLEIYTSKYVTQQEKALMEEATYTTGFLPKEYYSSKDVMKGRITRDKQIVKERASQARANKGKYSTTPAIER